VRDCEEALHASGTLALARSAPSRWRVSGITPSWKFVRSRASTQECCGRFIVVTGEIAPPLLPHRFVAPSVEPNAVECKRLGKQTLPHAHLLPVSRRDQQQRIGSRERKTTIACCAFHLVRAELNAGAHSPRCHCANYSRFTCASPIQLEQLALSAHILAYFSFVQLELICSSV
jgi:hypothetical protein